MHSWFKWLIPVVILVILVIVYIIPPPHKTFSELSVDVPDSQKALYQGFINQFAPHSLIVDGLAWEYITMGPQKEAVLFLHGMTGAYDIWWQQMLELRSNYKLISVTYPPTGSLEKLSQGIIAILDAENVPEVNIVGTSLGGYLAQYLMLNYPERIIRVVLSNTFPPNDLIRQENAWVGTALPFLPEWIIMKTLQGSITDNVVPASGEDPFTQAYLLALISGRISKAQFVSRYRAVVETFDIPDPLQQGIEVMIIESDNDPLVAESLRLQLRQTYPYAHVYRFTNAGHFPYLNRWNEYDTLLLKFLKLPPIE